MITGLGGPAGFGADALPPDDDNSSAAIPLGAAFPSGLEFFGTNYRDVFVNANGNVSFNMPLAEFTPMPFPVAAQPIIAAWWADVDTRGAAPPNENRVYWSVSPGRFIATWFRVGYFDSHTDLLNSFQIVLTDQSAAGAAGDFDVELRYAALTWTTGDASDGMMGMGGTPAQAGFDAGNSSDFFVLPGSLTARVLDLLTTSNVGVPGVWRFQIRSGAVTECGNGTVEAGEDCDDGNTTSGDGCSERCVRELPDGASCVDDIDCVSSFCVSGVCCDARCDRDCEFCDAAGACVPEPSGVICRDAIDVCDAFETCDGVARECPLDLDEPDGTSCTDELACNGEEICLGGLCDPGPPPDCDDLDPCTTDVCVEPFGCESTPIPGCVPPEDAGPGDGDGGVDAGASVDAGPMDGGALDPGTPRGSGLSCAVTATPRERAPLTLILAALGAWRWRRR